MSIELYVKDRFNIMNLFLPFIRSDQDRNMILHYLTGDEEEDEYQEEEPEEEEEEEPKDTTNIPITLDMVARISRREPTVENKHPISLDIDGKAYPYVSSGSFFGLYSSHDTVEEAVKSLHEWISQQKQWFKCYGRRIIVKLETVNEVTVKQQNLQAYF